MFKVNMGEFRSMKFQQALEEGYEYGPAVSVELLAKASEKIPKSKIDNWAKRHIRGLLSNMGSGSGATIHDNLNDISAMFSAFSLYIDPTSNKKIKDIAKREYEKVLQKKRARK